MLTLFHVASRAGFACLIALVCGCSTHFVADAPAVPATSETPAHSEFPARFAVARLVYGRPQAAGAKERAIWEALAERSQAKGQFAPLISDSAVPQRFQSKDLITTAHQQRFDYLLIVRMAPPTGSADVTLLHVGSGGVMATTQAISPKGGRRGFWGGHIRNPARLERKTYQIAQVAVPAVEDMLNAAAMRQPQ